MPKPVPITILAGFLGAGKTTLLQNLLQNKEGMKIGVIVNDLAAVNVDAALVKNSLHAASIELQNGCICCTLEKDLLDGVQKLVRANQLDYVVVECSGVAEPLKMAEIFNVAEDAGMPVSRVIKLTNLITVVDGRAFTSMMGCTDILDKRDDLAGLSKEQLDEGKQGIATGGSKRTVVNLLMEQVECADTLIISKVDTLTDDQVQRVQAVLASLNPAASLLKSAHGKVPLSALLKDEASEAAEKVGVPEEDEETIPEDRKNMKMCEREALARHEQGFGIKSFVYSSRRPFHPLRLGNILNHMQKVAPKALELMTGLNEEGQTEEEVPDPMKGLLRSKGYIYLANNPDYAYYWAHAGLHCQLEPAHQWWAAVDEEDWPSDPSLRASIAKDVKEGGESGDRRNEVVFIGVDVDKKAVTKMMDEALMGKDEMWDESESSRVNSRSTAGVEVVVIDTSKEGAPPKHVPGSLGTSLLSEPDGGGIWGNFTLKKHCSQCPICRCSGCVACCSCESSATFQADDSDLGQQCNPDCDTCLKCVCGSCVRSHLKTSNRVLVVLLTPRAHITVCIPSLDRYLETWTTHTACNDDLKQHCSAGCCSTNVPRSVWVQRAVSLALFSIVVCVLEAMLAIFFGFQALQWSLILFGLNSMIEIISSCMVFYRLRDEMKLMLPLDNRYSRLVDGRYGTDAIESTDVQPLTTPRKRKATDRERVATTVIGSLLVLLAALAGAGAVYRLIEEIAPSDTLPGLIISMVSTLIMITLYYMKMATARALDSSTVEKDALCQWSCVRLSLLVFIGAAIYAAFPQVWWIDSAGALVIMVIILKDGFVTISAAQDPDFDGCACCSTGEDEIDVGALARRQMDQIRTLAKWNQAD